MIVLLLVVPSTAIYLWRPSITPNHIWAMRRYLPAVLPGIIALAVVAIAWILGGRAVRALPTLGRGVVAALAAAVLVLPPVAATWPVRNVQERRGYLLALDRTCELVGDDAAVLLFAGGAWTQSVRSWCGVPAALASVRNPPTSAEVDALASAWAAQCRRLVLLTDDARSINRYADDVDEFQSSIPVGSGKSLETTFERRPSRYQADPSQLTLGKAVSRPSCSGD
jgi:hypothetical protein